MRLQSFGILGDEEKMAPLFALPALDGREIKLWSYKQRQPLVIYFIKGIENEFLTLLAQQYDAFQKENIEVLVITSLEHSTLRTNLVNLELPFPLLSDPDYRIHTRYIKLTTAHYDDTTTQDKLLAVFVIDRFGSIFRFATANNWLELPQQSEILDSHDFLSCLCNS